MVKKQTLKRGWLATQKTSRAGVLACLLAAVFIGQVFPNLSWLEAQAFTRSDETAPSDSDTEKKKPLVRLAERMDDLFNRAYYRHIDEANARMVRESLTFEQFAARYPERAETLRRIERLMRNLVVEMRQARESAHAEWVRVTTMAQQGRAQGHIVRPSQAAGAITNYAEGMFFPARIDEVDREVRDLYRALSEQTLRDENIRLVGAPRTRSGWPTTAPVSSAATYTGLTTLVRAQLDGLTESARQHQGTWNSILDHAAILGQTFTSLNVEVHRRLEEFIQAGQIRNPERLFDEQGTLKVHRIGRELRRNMPEMSIHIGILETKLQQRPNEVTPGELMHLEQMQARYKFAEFFVNNASFIERRMYSELIAKADPSTRAQLDALAGIRDGRTVMRPWARLAVALWRGPSGLSVPTRVLKENGFGTKEVFMLNMARVGNHVGKSLSTGVHFLLAKWVSDYILSEWFGTEPFMHVTVEEEEAQLGKAAESIAALSGWYFAHEAIDRFARTREMFSLGAHLRTAQVGEHLLMRKAAGLGVPPGVDPKIVAKVTSGRGAAKALAISSVRHGINLSFAMMVVGATESVIRSPHWSQVEYLGSHGFENLKWRLVGRILKETFWNSNFLVANLSAAAIFTLAGPVARFTAMLALRGAGRLAVPAGFGAGSAASAALGGGIIGSAFGFGIFVLVLVMAHYISYKYVQPRLMDQRLRDQINEKIENLSEVVESVTSRAVLVDKFDAFLETQPRIKSLFDEAPPFLSDAAKQRVAFLIASGDIDGARTQVESLYFVQERSEGEELDLFLPLELAEATSRVFERIRSIYIGLLAVETLQEQLKYREADEQQAKQEALNEDMTSDDFAVARDFVKAAVGIKAHMASVANAFAGYRSIFGLYELDQVQAEIQKERQEIDFMWLQVETELADLASPFKEQTFIDLVRAVYTSREQMSVREQERLKTLRAKYRYTVSLMVNQPPTRIKPKDFTKPLDLEGGEAFSMPASTISFYRRNFVEGELAVEGEDPEDTMHFITGYTSPFEPEPSLARKASPYQDVMFQALSEARVFGQFTQDPSDVDLEDYDIFQYLGVSQIQEGLISSLYQLVSIYKNLEQSDAEERHLVSLQKVAAEITEDDEDEQEDIRRNILVADRLTRQQRGFDIAAYDLGDISTEDITTFWGRWGAALERSGTWSSMFTTEMLFWFEQSWQLQQETSEEAVARVGWLAELYRDSGYTTYLKYLNTRYLLDWAFADDIDQSEYYEQKTYRARYILERLYDPDDGADPEKFSTTFKREASKDANYLQNLGEEVDEAIDPRIRPSRSPRLDNEDEQR